MTNRRNWLAFSLILAAAFQLGCMSTKQVTRKSQLKDPAETGPILLFSKDSVLYKLESYGVVDSNLIASGTAEKDGVSRQFSGSIKLNEILYVQSRHLDFVRTMFASAAVGVVGITAMFYLTSAGPSIKAQELTHYFRPSTGGGGGGGGGSCPYIYSWDRKQFILDAEAFGVALGKAQEYMTSSLLPSLKEEDSLVKVRIANERPETHYINCVSMNAYECDSNAKLYLDANNVAWPVYKSESPIGASDNLGRDILRQVNAKDNIFWGSNLVQAHEGSDLEDIVELTFANSSVKEEGSLIIDAINSKFNNAVMDYFYGFLGDQYLAFMYSVETDSEFVRIFKDWISESSVKAYLWSGQQWQLIGSILPEANSVPFSRALHFSTRGAGDIVRIRLKALADVWKFDAINVDWTPVAKLNATPVRLISAVRSDGRDERAALESADKDYVMLLPPQYVNLSFEAVKPARGKKIVYAFNAQGYLYEWMTEKRQSDVTFASFIPEQMKIPYLKKLLQNKGLFLPPIYAMWRTQSHVH